jgi:hypothetical protein
LKASGAVLSRLKFDELLSICHPERSEGSAFYAPEAKVDFRHRRRNQMPFVRHGFSRIDTPSVRRALNRLVILSAAKNLTLSNPPRPNLVRNAVPQPKTLRKGGASAPP